MVASGHTWTIVVDDGAWPHTNFDDDDAANGVTAGGSGGSVTAPSPNSPKLWGAGTAKGGTLDIPSWLVLATSCAAMRGWAIGERTDRTTRSRGAKAAIRRR